MMYNRRLKFGFTLSEVLITLVIIGVIAAMTVPSINANKRKAQYKSSLFKVLSTLNQASLKYYNKYGENPRCGYWKVTPYSESAECAERNEKGQCLGYILDNGEDLPADYVGLFDDCQLLWRSFYTSLSVQKICANNSYDNGCIPKYKGRDELYSAKNPDKSEYEINEAIYSEGFDQSRILSGSAIVLNDGSILFTYMNESARYLAVDLNGKKGPNKWGTDLYTIRPEITSATMPPAFKLLNDSLLDSGSISGKDLLYK